MVHMDISTALETLGFTDINSIDRQILKQRYRRLMKENHPDLYRGDSTESNRREEICKNLNNANNEIIKVLDTLDSIKKWESLTKKQRVKTIIPFDGLIGLYKGQELNLKGLDGEEFILTRSNFRSHDIMLYIECDIILTQLGIARHFTTITPYTISDTYDIHCTITLNGELFNNIEAIVKAYGKEIKLQLTSDITRLKLSYDPRVFIIVNIEKKRPKDT